MVPFSSLAEIEVLVLDDDQFTLDVTRAVLQRMGVEQVVCFDSARQAEEALSGETTTNLIICDLQMPDIDGIQFLRWLAAQHCEIPVILFSGTDEKVLHAAEQLALEYRLKILGSLRKPVDASELEALLLADLDPRESSSSAAATSDMEPSELEQAIRDSIVLYYQPKIRLSDRSIAGFEALLRWSGNTDLSPFAFVRAAESRQMIDHLTARVFELAVQDLRKWRDAGIQPHVSVNISAANLQNLDLPEMLSSLLAESKLPTDRITLELTETAVVEDLGLSLDVLTRVRLKGFELSLDDFGTGYASLDKLTRMPFNELKLDRGFIVGSRNSEDTSKVLKAAVVMAHELKLMVVAEGVESDQDLQLIESLGCDLAQGYMFSPAMPPGEIVDFCRNWQEHRV